MPTSVNPPPQHLVDALVQYYDALVGYLARMPMLRRAQHSVRVDDAAREAVHEVCLQLLHEAPQLGTVRVPEAYLRTLSKRRAIDTLRREAYWSGLVVQSDEEDALLHYAAPASAQPEQRLAARQQLQQLAQAIEALPPRCRDVFVLHKIHGWSHAAVAVHLAISTKTVEKHVRIGVACCRVAMSAMWDDAPLPEPAAHTSAP